jgi:hypothetical protein
MLQFCSYVRELRLLLRDTCILVMAACILVALVLERTLMIELKERLYEATRIQMQGWDAHFITRHCISRKGGCDLFLRDDTCRCRRRHVAKCYALCTSHPMLISLVFRCGDRYCMFCRILRPIDPPCSCEICLVCTLASSHAPPRLHPRTKIGTLCTRPTHV